MDILINELSLDGQFIDENSFIDSLEPLLQIIKLIKQFDLMLLKNHTFSNSKVTISNSFLQVITSSNQKIRQNNSIRLIKSYLLSKPYWNDTKVHSCNTDSYTFDTNNICNTSLAESSQRDKIVISFKHNGFLDKLLDIEKNSSILKIYNISDKKLFLDYLLNIHKIDILNYCKEKFKKTNLDFNLLQDGYGFDILNSNQKNEFVNSFNMFSDMSWVDISNSDGLEYKKYNKPKKKKLKAWFREGIYKDTDIYKFRTTQGYRCFGYREENIFYILRFEIDHSISDNG